MSKLHERQQARVLFRFEPDQSYPGTVARLGKEADRETREFIVDVHVLALPNNWVVGQRAEVFIEADRKDNVLLVPATYIVHREQATGVIVVTHDYRALDVFDTIYKMEDGVIQRVQEK